MEERRKKLTDEEADIIANKLWDKFKSELYLNAGKGVVNLAWKLVVLTTFAFAVYGYTHGWFR